MLETKTTLSFKSTIHICLTLTCSMSPTKGAHSGLIFQLSTSEVPTMMSAVTAEAQRLKNHKAEL